MYVTLRILLFDQAGIPLLGFCEVGAPVRLRLARASPWPILAVELGYDSQQKTLGHDTNEREAGDDRSKTFGRLCCYDGVQCTLMQPPGAFEGS